MLYSSVNVLNVAELFTFKYAILLCEFHLNTIFKRKVLTNRSQLPIKKKVPGQGAAEAPHPTPPRLRS